MPGPEPKRGRPVSRAREAGLHQQLQQRAGRVRVQPVQDGQFQFVSGVEKLPGHSGQEGGAQHFCGQLPVFLPTAILTEASYFSCVLKFLASFKIIIWVFSHLNILHRTPNS